MITVSGGGTALFSIAFALKFLAEVKRFKSNQSGIDLPKEFFKSPGGERRLENDFNSLRNLRI